MHCQEADCMTRWTSICAPGRRVKIRLAGCVDRLSSTRSTPATHPTNGASTLEPTTAGLHIWCCIATRRQRSNFCCDSAGFHSVAARKICRLLEHKSVGGPLCRRGAGCQECIAAWAENQVFKPIGKAWPGLELLAWRVLRIKRRLLKYASKNIRLRGGVMASVRA